MITQCQKCGVLYNTKLQEHDCPHCYREVEDEAGPIKRNKGGKTMKLEEAIETNTRLLRSLEYHKEEDLYKALSLGIEALKRLIRCRGENCDSSFDDLPGETEE